MSNGAEQQPLTLESIAPVPIAQPPADDLPEREAQDWENERKKLEVISLHQDIKARRELGKKIFLRWLGPLFPQS